MLPILVLICLFIVAVGILLCYLSLDMVESTALAGFGILITISGIVGIVLINFNNPIEIKNIPCSIPKPTMQIVRALDVDGTHYMNSYVLLDSTQIHIFYPDDTVWVNLKTHLLDDVDSNAHPMVLWPTK